MELFEILLELLLVSSYTSNHLVYTLLILIDFVIFAEQLDDQLWQISRLLFFLGPYDGQFIDLVFVLLKFFRVLVRYIVSSLNSFLVVFDWLVQSGQVLLQEKVGYVDTLEHSFHWSFK